MISIPTHAAPNNRQKVIAVVHSYHADFGWVKEVDKGIDYYQRNLKIFGNTPKPIFKEYKLIKFHMNAKHHLGDTSYLKNKGLQIIEELNKIRPGVTIICDDEALEYVTKPLLNDSRHRFVFLGINNDPREYGVVNKYSCPEYNVTGLVSEHPFYYTIKLAIKIIPDYKDILVFFDNSPSGKGILKNFQREVKKLEPSIKKHFKDTVVSNDWNMWKKVILMNQDPKNLFVFGTFYGLRDKSGKRLTTKDVAWWLSKHSSVADLTILTNHVAEGFLLAISNPGFVHGYEASEKAAQIIEGTPISKVPVEVPKRKAVHLNMARAKRLNLKVPVEIIAISQYFNELGY